MNRDATKQQYQMGAMTFVVGFLAGLVSTALFTPKSGPEMRRHIKDTASKAKEKGKEVVDTAATKVSNSANAAASKVKQLTDEATEKVNL